MTGPHQLGRCATQHCDVSGMIHRFCSYHDTYSTRPSFSEKYTRGTENPRRIRAVAILQRTFCWFVMCKPFWSVHGLTRSTRLCTASELQRPRVSLTYRWTTQHIPSCKSRGMCWALPTCVHGLARPTHERERQVHWVSFLGDGSFFCQSGFACYFCVQTLKTPTPHKSHFASCTHFL